MYLIRRADTCYATPRRQPKTGGFRTRQNRPYNSRIHPLQGRLGSLSGCFVKFEASGLTRSEDSLGWRDVRVWGMRSGISISVTAEDRVRLAAITADRNAPQKHVWRASIVLLTADGLGTTEIVRRTGKSKPCVWRWQERFMQAGVDGLLRDKTRPPGKPPLPTEVVRKVVDLTVGEPPAETTHWTGRMMAQAAGISLRSVQRIWGHTVSIRTASAASSCRGTRSSPTSSRTSSASMSIRRRMRSCCRSTRRARFRRSTAASLACR